MNQGPIKNKPKPKKVYKYATGVEIPAGAQYLSTQVETNTGHHPNSKTTSYITETTIKHVWHYFLVEVEGE